MLSTRMFSEVAREVEAKHPRITYVQEVEISPDYPTFILQRILYLKQNQ
jgi:hypothetical protein